MAGNELNAANLHPSVLMTTVRMVEWMRLNAEVTKLREDMAFQNVLDKKSEKIGVMTCQMLSALDAIRACDFSLAGEILERALCGDSSKKPLKKRGAKTKRRKD